MTQGIKSALLSIFAIHLSLSSIVYAQESKQQNPSRQIFEERLSHLVSDGIIDEEMSQSLQERYEQLLLNPLDLNVASLEEIKSLPLISEYEAYQCFLYRANKRSQFTDISEIKEIPSWSDELCTLLYPLLRLTQHKDISTKTSLSRLVREGKSQVSMLSSYTHNNNKAKQYIGSPDALSIIYRYRQDKTFSLALGAQKDAYEPWHLGKHKGFDSYHGHIALRNSGIIQHLIIGQYRASWGEGLILNQGFQLRSTLYGRRSQGVRPVFGLSEYGISQGIALDISLSKQFSLSTLASWRRIDGALDSETRLITGLYEGGLHRDERSLIRKGNIPQHHYGIRLAFALPRLNLALQAIHYDYGQNILAHAPGVVDKARFNYLNKFGNISLSYTHTSPSGRSIFSGEVAQSANAALAIMQRGSYHSPRADIHASVYWISPHYWSYLGQSYNHYHYPHNEYGANLGIIIPLLRLRISTESSVYGRPTAPTAEKQALGLAGRAEIRYRWSKYLDSRLHLSSHQDSKQRHHRLSLTLKHQTEALSLSLQAQLSSTGRKSDAQKTSNSYTYTAPAYALGLTLHYNQDQKYRLWLNASYQHIDDWDNRIYLYSPRLSEEYGFTALYGQGWYLSSGAVYHLNKHISLGLKAVHQSNNLIKENILSLQFTHHIPAK